MSNQNVIMKAVYPNSDESRHPTRLCILLGKFRIESFPVEVRGSRHEQIEPAANLSQARDLQQVITIQEKLNPVDIVPRSAKAVNRGRHRVSMSS